MQCGKLVLTAYPMPNYFVPGNKNFKQGMSGKLDWTIWQILEIQSQLLHSSEKPTLSV